MSYTTFMYRQLFQDIFTFSQIEFQTAFAHSFLMDIGLHHFIYDSLDIRTILNDHPDLGAHTNIVNFQPGAATSYMWTHPSVRPMGTAIYNQCRKCYSLNHFRITVTDDYSKTIHKCTKCKDRVSYTIPQGWNWINDASTKADERGSWLVKKEVS